MRHRHRTFRTVLIAISAVLCTGAITAHAQNYPGWGFVQPYANSYMRQQQMYDRQQAQAARQQYQAQQRAYAQAQAPHEASANYTGQLTPMGGDLSSYVAGKTLYLERPIVANSQIQSMRTNETYFAADRKSYSIAWSGRPWMVSQNRVCLDSVSPQNCWQVFQDSAQQVFFMASNNILMHVAHVERGDAANTKAQYAQNQRQMAANNKMAAAAIGALAGVLFSSGGGGGSNNTQYYYQNGSSGGSGGGGSSYTAPIGGENGLYGSSHGVGD